MTLVTKKAEIEVFRTDYTCITVVPNMSRNAFETASLNGEYTVPEIKEGEYAIEWAEFTDETAAGYFKLQVVDDRTLEIIPTAAALQAADTNDKALKGSYKSAINVWISSSGEDNRFTTDVLTLMVKKSQPKIKANAVKLNSFIYDEQPVVFSGGTVTKITAAEGMPGWLAPLPYDLESINPEELTLEYKGAILTEAPKSLKETIKLTVQAEGWAVDQVVSVPVTAAPIQPKVTFSSKSVTINPTFDESNREAVVGITVNPADYLERDEIAFDWLVTKNGAPVSSEVLKAELKKEHNPDESNKGFFIHINTGEQFGNMEKARTFKFTLTVGGKEFPLTIKTLSQNKAALSIGAKAKGTIDSAVPNSAVTLDVTLKNTSYVDPAIYGGDWSRGKYIVQILRMADGGETADTVRFIHFGLDSPFTLPEKFEFFNAGLTRITLTQADLETEQKPFDPDLYTYMARVVVNYGETATALADAKIPVKASDPNNVPLTVTAKAKGKIDVLNPDSAVLLTPTIKNGYDIDLKNRELAELKYYVKDGKEYIEINGSLSGLFTAEPNAEGTGFLIRMTPGYGVNHKTDRFFVKFSVTDPADDTRTAETKQYIALPLTMGKAKITQDTTALTFLKKDKNSSGSIILGTENPAHRIVGAEITNDRQGLYQLTEVGYGTYVISCTDRVTPKTAKNTTLKLAVTLAENNSGSPNATVSVKIRWA